MSRGLIAGTGLYRGSCPTPASRARGVPPLWGMPTVGVRSRRSRPASRCTPTVSMSLDHAQPGAVPRVALSQAGLPRRRVYPPRNLVRPHAENGLVVFRSPDGPARSGFIVSALTSR